MNDGTLMLVGSAVSFFREARAYDQPLYNFFQIFELKHLTFDQMLELFRRRAKVDEIENFEEKLKANLTRLRVLEYFATGNPRLVSMLYCVINQSDQSEVRLALEKLLDEVTPYFKAKIESLPPQQRKILDHIARISSKTNEGLTPTEIAIHTRLSPNQVSSQLKRLSELGYVRSANLSGRNSFYTLSEPLYAVWHQMRFSPNARQKIQWLVEFLSFWFSFEKTRDKIQKIVKEQKQENSVEYLNNVLSVEKNAFFNLVTVSLATTSKLSHIECVRNLIRQSQFKNQFDPLVRAIDYLKIGDQSPIEKLSPEVRQIVKQVIKTLQVAIPETLSSNFVKPALQPQYRSQKQLNNSPFA